MAVHMIRVVASPSLDGTAGLSLTEINDALDDWKSTASEWDADPETHDMSEVEAEGTDSDDTFYVGTYRFELSDAKDTLLTTCEDTLKTDVDWYRLLYHECDHDEADRDGCVWDDKREATSVYSDSIPSYVPDADVSS